MSPSDLVDPLSHLGDYAASALKAATAGNWMIVVVLAAILGVALGRKLLSTRFPFLATDLGAVAFTFVAGTLGAVATALMAGSSPLSWAMFLMAMKGALGAMGGFAAVKKALWPLALILARKAGLNLGPDAHATIAKATAAGDAAVAAKPPTGLPAPWIVK